MYCACAWWMPRTGLSAFDPYPEWNRSSPLVRMCECFNDFCFLYCIFVGGFVLNGDSLAKALLSPCHLLWSPSVWHGWTWLILYIKNLKNQRNLESKEQNTTSCCIAIAFSITSIIHIVPTLSPQTCLYVLIPRNVSAVKQKKITQIVWRMRRSDTEPILFRAPIIHTLPTSTV